MNLKSCLAVVVDSVALVALPLLLVQGLRHGYAIDDKELRWAHSFVLMAFLAYSSGWALIGGYDESTFKRRWSAYLPTLIVSFLYWTTLFFMEAAGGFEGDVPVTLLSIALLISVAVMTLKRLKVA